MNTDKFNDFILNENQHPSVKGYLEQISSILEQLTPTSQRDRERISIIKQHILEIRRLLRRQENKSKTETASEESV